MSPVRYDPAMESIGADEARLTAEIVDQLLAGSAAVFERHAHAMRAAHVKSYAILKGELIVADDLPAEWRQGVFAARKRYDVIARLSSSPADIHTDATPAPRGFAIKLIGVDGPRLAPEIPGANQDFLMVNFPALPFGTIETYKGLVAVLQANENRPEALQQLIADAANGIRNALSFIGIEPGATLEALARDNAHPLGETYSTQGALRFGDHVAKLALKPKSNNVQALTGEAPQDVAFSTLRDAVAGFFAEEETEFELSAQLCVDIARMPIEDVSVIWPEALSPHRPVATLRFKRQASYSPARRVYGDDALAFSPWNGIEAHRPLGGLMRVRRAAYAASAKYRFETNARVRTEPGRIGDVPD